MKKIIYSILATTLLFVSCKKENTEPEDHNHDHNHGGDKATVMLQVNNKYGQDEIELGKQFNREGRLITFSRIQYYISQINLVKMNGDSVVAPNEYVLSNASTMDMHTLGSFNPDHYHEITFGIGVDSETNNQSLEDFTNRNENDPLAVQNPTMHWTWDTGYKFMVLEGQFDENEDGLIDENEGKFTYHLAKDEMYKSLSFMLHADVEATQSYSINLNLDFEALLDGVDIFLNPMGHGPKPESTNIILSNYEDAFSIEMEGNGHSH